MNAHQENKESQINGWVVQFKKEPTWKLELMVKGLAHQHPTTALDHIRAEAAGRVLNKRKGGSGEFKNVSKETDSNDVC